MKNILPGAGNKLKVRTKLIIGFSAILVLLWLIVVYAGDSFGNLNRQFSAVEEDIIPDTIAMTEVETISSEIYHDVTEYLYYDIEEAKSNAQLKLSRLEEIGLEYLPVTALPGTVEHGKDRILAGKISDFYFSATWIIDLKERGADYTKLLARDRTMCLPALLSMQQRAGELKAASIAELTTAKAAFEKAYTSGVRSTFISAGFLTLLAITAAIIVTRSIVQPLHTLRKGTEMIAKGKLDYKVGTDARDEIGGLSRDFDQMTQSLSTSMTSIDNLNQEIAERKRSEEKQQAIIKTALDGFWICDLEGRFIEVNDSYCKMTGYTREELLEMSIQDIEAIEKPERTAQRIKKIVEHGSDRFETQHKRKDGKIIDMEISVNYLNIGEGQMFVFARDITGRKRAEEALANEALRRRILIEQSGDGIVVLDQNGNVYESNQRFAEMLGYSSEEVLRLQVWDWEFQFPHEQVLDMIRSIDETGDHFETQHRRKDGTIYDVEISTNGAVFAGEKLIFCVCRDITERKRAEEALRESEEKFSAAFRSSPGSMSISRLKDGTFIEVNESFLRDKGYTREEVIGRSSMELGIWKDEEHRNQVLQMLQEQGRVHNEPTQFRTKSGEIRTGFFSAELVSLGNEPCMIILTTDTTQLKQAEEQLRLLSSVTRQVSDSIIFTDPDSKITYMNQAAQDLFGYTIEEVLGKGLGIFNDKPVSKKARQKILRTLASRKVWSTTATKQCKDGRTIICDCRLTPLFDEKGEICSYIDVQRDITKQKEVEGKLQVHKQLIERILATMPEGVLVIDSNDRILLANEAFYKISHTGKEAIANKLLNEIIPVNQLFNLYKAVKQGNKENNTLEFRYQVKDLEKRIACVITKMDGGRTLLTFTDVSQEREEEEKLYLTDRLASIGEMAAGLAHELNNPLTGVLALSQLLMDSDLSEEHKEDLQCVYSEAKRAASIVKNVLLFARNNNYENGQASTNEVIRDVLRLREYEEKVSNITAATKLQENLPDIPIDKFQLQQVFLNLILNAEAAIKEANRPGKLSVTTERVNNHINIHFKDNGRGIKKHLLSRIFDPFFTTKDIGKGTGLGLSICYGIVVKHGGKISVKTRVNQGTTFSIRMPVAPQTV